MKAACVSAHAKPPKISETAEHRTIAAYFKKIGLGDGARAYHIRNERVGDMQRVTASAMGVASGLPDWLFVHNGKAGWIELKPRGWKVLRARTGNYTGHERRQLDRHAELRAAGCWVYICETLDEILELLRFHGVPLRTESITTERIRAGFAAAQGQAGVGS